MVIAPANTGNDSSNRSAVIATDQTNSGVWSSVILSDRMLIAVVIKFTAPKIDEIPARCSEKMARSTDPPPWAIAPASGG